MPAIFTIEPRSGVPIYLQLIEQIKRAVALGTLEDGEQLPTVKSLALDLTVNPNTVARAYRDLERDGVIATSPGRGSFVRGGDGNDDTPRRAASEIAAAIVSEAMREARALGLRRADIEVLVTRALERWFGSSEG